MTGSSTATPPLPAGTLSAVARHYRAGEPQSCEPVAHGLLNRGYRLSTSRGEFFLKHYLDGDEALIARQHRATLRLEGMGLPVAPPLPARDGRTVTVLDGRRFALYPWIEGRHREGVELSVEQSRRLGSLLGTVHTCLARVQQAVEQPPSRESADPADTHRLIGDLLGRIRQRDRRDAFDRLAERRLAERRELLERHAHRRPRAGTEPASGWVHGDFHPLNVLYRGPEPVAIVDWDRLDVQPRAEEAVRAAAIFFLRPGCGTLDLDKVRAYARAYRRTARASAGELAAAVHRVWWERLNDFWMLSWRYQLQDHRTDPLFPAAAALVVWWTREYDAVLAAFAR
ncbi:phosphotransferase [Streptomyces sp. HB2AG]|uniref:phosphotransferase n=1 Tax=Streptomyces sp. HB2AG TaxID=2983400 RepID=UPI0022AA2EF1|nr:phosphotransferase [Streptomyces sp. HB2AG]MCZ2524722.1 phosphotransferase [Streptomyces sp. HB2AG]